MRLEPLCELEFAYREVDLYKSNFVLMRPFGSEEGFGYGEGDGSVSGSKLNGKMRWVNHPRRRSDGAMQPDVHGVIVTEDGSKLLFVLEGITIFQGEKGNQLLRLIFTAEDERYRWLNTAFCVLEGIINANTSTMNARAYVCINELPE